MKTIKESILSSTAISRMNLLQLWELLYKEAHHSKANFDKLVKDKKVLGSFLQLLGIDIKEYYIDSYYRNEGARILCFNGSTLVIQLHFSFSYARENHSCIHFEPTPKFDVVEAAKVLEENHFAITYYDDGSIDCKPETQFDFFESILSSTGTGSAVFIRRKFYELFLKSASVKSLRESKELPNFLNALGIDEKKCKISFATGPQVIHIHIEEKGGGLGDIILIVLFRNGMNNFAVDDCWISTTDMFSPKEIEKKLSEAGFYSERKNNNSTEWRLKEKDL